MTRYLPSLRSLLVLLALGAIIGPDAAAQVRRGRTQPTAPPWSPISIGVRFGWDQVAVGEVLGAQLRIPVVRSGVVEIMPHAELVWPRRSRDEQVGVEVAFVPGGVRRGVFLAGGVAWRETSLGAQTAGGPRDSFFGYSLALGGMARLGRLEVEAALRWVFLNDSNYSPNAATVGVSFPFWRARPAVQ